MKCYEHQKQRFSKIKIEVAKKRKHKKTNLKIREVSFYFEAPNGQA
jgi:hypothetical protein